MKESKLELNNAHNSTTNVKMGCKKWARSCQITYAMDVVGCYTGRLLAGC